MIPLNFMFAVWLAASVLSGYSSCILFRRRRNSLAITMFSIFFASVGMLTFYFMLVFTPIYANNEDVAIAWSRVSISIMALVVLGGSIASIILNKGKPVDDE